MSEESSEVKTPTEEVPEKKEKEGEGGDVTVVRVSDESKVEESTASGKESEDESNEALIWKKKAQEAEAKLQALKVTMEKSQVMRPPGTPLSSSVSSPLSSPMPDGSSVQATSMRLDRAKVKLEQCIASLNDAAESMQRALIDVSTNLINSGSVNKSASPMSNSVSMVNISAAAVATEGAGEAMRSSIRRSSTRRASVGSQKPPDAVLSARGPANTPSQLSRLPPRSASVESVADQAQEPKQRMHHSARYGGSGSGLRSSVMPTMIRMRQQLQRQGDSSSESSSDDTPEKIVTSVAQLEATSMALMDATTLITARTRHILEALTQVENVAYGVKKEEEAKQDAKMKDYEMLYQLTVLMRASEERDRAVRKGVSGSLRTADELYELAKSENVSALEITPWIRKNLVITSSEQTGKEDASGEQKQDN